MIRFSIPLVSICLTSLISCNSFENQFYENLELAQSKAVINGSDTFDLSRITDFVWDSVIFISGNESVPIFKEQVEEILNRRESKIHWEDRRFNNLIDSTFKYKADDIPVNRECFYFLTPEKEIIVKTIKRGEHDNHKVDFYINYCLPSTLNESQWLSKLECKFIAKVNAKPYDQKTVFLYPKCRPNF